MTNTYLLNISMPVCIHINNTQQHKLFICHWRPTHCYLHLTHSTYHWFCLEVDRKWKFPF